MGNTWHTSNRFVAGPFPTHTRNTPRRASETSEQASERSCKFVSFPTAAAAAAAGRAARRQVAQDTGSRKQSSRRSFSYDEHTEIYVRRPMVPWLGISLPDAKGMIKLWDEWKKCKGGTTPIFAPSRLPFQLLTHPLHCSKYPLHRGMRCSRCGARGKKVGMQKKGLSPSFASTDCR